MMDRHRCECINIKHEGEFRHRCPRDAPLRCTVCGAYVCRPCAKLHHAHQNQFDEPR